MKLLRYGPKGQEKPGLLDQHGKIRDLSKVVDDIAGDTLSDAGLAKIRAIDPATLPEVTGESRIGPCVARVGKMVCIGLNYADHAAESNLPVPHRTRALRQSGRARSAARTTTSRSAQLEEDRLGSRTWRGDRQAREVHRRSQRARLRRGLLRRERRFRARMADRARHAVGQGQGLRYVWPARPWLVTKDEIADPQKLDLWLEVDGHRYQNGNTKTMVFGVAQLVAYLSNVMSLQPATSSRPARPRVWAHGREAGTGVPQGGGSRSVSGSRVSASNRQRTVDAK